MGALEKENLAITMNSFEFLVRHAMSLVHTTKGKNQHIHCSFNLGHKGCSMAYLQHSGKLINVLNKDQIEDGQRYTFVIAINGNNHQDERDQLETFVHETYHLWLYLHFGSFMAGWEKYNNAYGYEMLNKVERTLETGASEFIDYYPEHVRRLYRWLLSQDIEREQILLADLQRHFLLFPWDLPRKLRYSLYRWQEDYNFWPTKSEINTYIARICR